MTRATEATSGFAARLGPIGAEFDERIARWIDALPGDIPNLADGLRYAFALDLPAGSARGKRLRPALCLLTAEALGGATGPAWPFALAIELMHNFALVHDDIEDEDRVRRGRPAVWVRYGLAHGVNIGDYALVQVFRVLLDDATALPPELRVALLSLMAEALEHTHRGQALDINARAARHFSLADYDRIVREKTGHYLAAPLLGGAIVAGADDTVRAALEQFGLCIGPMFQIMDDVIDLTEGKGRGERGSDIREGKRSFLVAWTLERAAPAERDELLAILDTPRDATTAAMVSRAEEIFVACGAIDAARRRAEALRAEADEVCASLPPRLAALLRDFAAYLASRTT